MGINIDQQKLNDLRFADNIVLVSGNLQGTMFIMVHLWFKRVHLITSLKTDRTENKL